MKWYWWALIICAAFFFIVNNSLFENRHLNPAAIVVVREIQSNAFEYNTRSIADREKLKITQSVEEISKREEFMDFPQVYHEIEELKYYNLPPLYWNEVPEDQKQESFATWEKYMKKLMSQCDGLWFVEFSEEQAKHCKETKKKQIQEKRQQLF